MLESPFPQAELPSQQIVALAIGRLANGTIQKYFFFNDAKNKAFVNLAAFCPHPVRRVSGQTAFVSLMTIHDRVPLHADTKKPVRRQQGLVTR